MEETDARSAGTLDMAAKYAVACSEYPELRLSRRVLFRRGRCLAQTSRRVVGNSGSGG